MPNGVTVPPRRPDGTPDGSQAELRMRRWMRWAMIAFFVLLIGLQFVHARGPEETTGISYTTFYELINEGKVQSATIQGQSVNGQLKAPEVVEGRSRTAFKTTLPS